MLKLRSLLFLPAFSALLGCQSQLAARTPDQELAAENTTAASTLESDQAGVVFARKTLELAEKQAASQASAGQKSSRKLERARVDLLVAQSMLHMAQEKQQALSEYSEWRRFAKEPIMTTASQDPE